MPRDEFDSVPAHEKLLPSTLSREGLQAILETSGIPLDQFGRGAAKTIEHLLSEVREGESILRIRDTGELERHVRVLWLDVLCDVPGQGTFLLREDRQEYQDGRVKRRNLTSSLGEKLKPAELPNGAVMRALSEEIGVDDVESVYAIGEENRTFMPDTFPGILSHYQMFKFVATISPEHFVAEGYVEYQPDKTNYYVWDMIHAV